MCAAKFGVSNLKHCLFCAESEYNPFSVWMIGWLVLFSYKVDPACNTIRSLQKIFLAV